MPGKTDQPGMVVDPLLLDNITRDIQEGYTGANGFRAEHAFIVTWYRVCYSKSHDTGLVLSFRWPMVARHVL